MFHSEATIALFIRRTCHMTVMLLNHVTLYFKNVHKKILLLQIQD